MAKLWNLVIKYKKLIIISNILLTLIFALFLKDLTINADIMDYLPESDETAALYRYIGDNYGGSQVAMIALETDQIFTKQIIADIARITRNLKTIAGIDSVTSLADVIDIKSSEWGIEIGRLVDEYDPPEAHEDIQTLRSYVMSKDMYKGRLVSTNERSTLIICRMGNDADKAECVKGIRKVIDESGVSAKVYYAGLPFQIIEITDIIVEDLIILVPIVCMIVLLCLIWSFRRARGVLIPLLTVLMSVVWTMGCMSLLGIPLTIITNITPVVLIAVGSAYSIHIINKFNQDAASGTPDEEHYVKLLSEIGLPVFLAGFTTMTGFLAFVFGSYLIMIREFGIITCLGVLATLLVSLSFVPSLLIYLGPGKERAGQNKKEALDRFTDFLGRKVPGNKKSIIIAGVFVVIFSAFWLPEITREVDLMGYFPSDTDIQKAENFMEKSFGGSMPIEIVVKGDLLDPKVLKQMKTIQQALEDKFGLNHPDSIVSLIEEMNYAMGEGREIPAEREKIINLWFLLEGEEAVTRVVNDDRTEGLISATTGTLDTAQLKLAEDIDEYLNTIDSDGLETKQSGVHLIYKTLDQSLVNSQVQSLLIALLVLFICNLVLIRTIRGGLLALVPLVFTLFVLFGVMGLAEIPIDIATVLAGSISLGIGVDYSIHLLSGIRRFSIMGEEMNKTVSLALATTGKAIMINVVTVAAGIATLVFANLIPLQRFGVLIVVTMIGSGIGALTILPAAAIYAKIDKYIKRSK